MLRRICYTPQLWLVTGIILQGGLVLAPDSWHLLTQFVLAFVSGTAWSFYGGLKYAEVASEELSAFLDTDTDE